MKWSYQEGGHEQGPVEEAVLEELARQGRITADTPVRAEDRLDWRPYREALSVPRVACQECGKLFTMEEAIRFGDAWVCATCKPIFLQKLREGVESRPELPYAGFGVRLAAAFLDGLMTYALCYLVGLAFGRTLLETLQPLRDGPASDPRRDVLFMGINMLIGLLYETLFLGRFGATPGKLACGIRVTTEDGGRISYARALGRHLAKYLSSVILYIGFIMAAFDREKRALHDHICRTRVIRPSVPTSPRRTGPFRHRA